MPLARAW